MKIKKYHPLIVVVCINIVQADHTGMDRKEGEMKQCRKCKNLH